MQRGRDQRAEGCTFLSLTSFLRFQLINLQFLEKDPTQRLGCAANGQGFKDIQAHPWFAGIEWKALENKEAQPPFVPDVCQVTPGSFSLIDHPRLDEASQL